MFDIWDYKNNPSLPDELTDEFKIKGSRKDQTIIHITHAMVPLPLLMFLLDSKQFLLLKS